MKEVTVFQNEVYEVRESAKGYSQALYFYFNKERAEYTATTLNELAKENGWRQKYRVITRKCVDSIVYIEKRED